MASKSGQKVENEAPYLNAYELQRAERITANQKRLEELGIAKQITLLTSGFRSTKRVPTPKKPKSTTPSLPSRSSRRLQILKPEFYGITEDEEAVDSDGKQKLSKPIVPEVAWTDTQLERRCDNKNRGSLYDSFAGITCHFCRQKKLCGEENCPRCSTRDATKECIGKSECQKCFSANGRFCRACLKVRYGEDLDTVRKQVAAGTWLCPHCYEEEHPCEDWICNSSICMTRRGLKPTGIAIFEAQKAGYPSVAHYVQAQTRARKGLKPAAPREPFGMDAPAAVGEPAAVAETPAAASAALEGNSLPHPDSLLTPRGAAASPPLPSSPEAGFSAAAASGASPVAGASAVLQEVPKVPEPGLLTPRSGRASAALGVSRSKKGRDTSRCCKTQGDSSRTSPRRSNRTALAEKN